MRLSSIYWSGQLLQRFQTQTLLQTRHFSPTSRAEMRALVLGLYKDDKSTSFTKSTQAYLDAQPELKAQIDKVIGGKFAAASARMLYSQTDYDVVCLTNIGEKDQGYDEMEEVDMDRENIRAAVSKSVQILSALVPEEGTESISARTREKAEVTVDGCGDPEASAEGAWLANYAFDDHKSTKQPRFEISPLELSGNALDQWTKGQNLADAQNFARWLMENPANHMTPTKFAEAAKKRLPDNCEVIVRDQAWIESEKMGAFLAIAKGSVEPPKLVEIIYNGGSPDAGHAAIVGKGVTFDAGGISIKPSANMDAMRADMGGGACTLASMYGVAKLRLPINVRAYIPLAENLPSGTAIKPGDVVTTRSGKTVQIDNTDAEGRLLLADALHYACSHGPVCVLDMATLTGAIVVALGAAATGTFTNSATLWQGLHESGKTTGDRVWRMPLYKLYTSHMNKAPLADLNNIGSHAGQGGACTAAAFLQQFVDCKHWAHLDIAGVMSNTDQVPYLSKGMAGRPTRTIIQFLENLKLSDYSK